jgi:hypothetical protein
VQPIPVPITNQTEVHDDATAATSLEHTLKQPSGITTENVVGANAKGMEVQEANIMEVQTEPIIEEEFGACNLSDRVGSVPPFSQQNIITNGISLSEDLVVQLGELGGIQNDVVDVEVSQGIIANQTLAKKPSWKRRARAQNSTFQVGTSQVFRDLML